MGVRPISRLIVIYIRFVSRIATALVLLVPCSAHARDLEDKIVFVSRIHGTAKSDLFLVEGLDGRRIQLTQNLYASCPSISPDGNQVVFVSEPPWEQSNILKLNLANRPPQIENLSENIWQHTGFRDLDWSPDGRKILFIMTKATRNPKGETTSLCVMDMRARSTRHVLQPNLPTRISNPSWSPDSEHILYLQADEGMSHRRLFITDDNGSNVAEVRREALENVPDSSLSRAVILPAWPPRRTQIAYIGLIETFRSPPNPLQIYSMNLAEGSVAPLTSGGAENRFPLAWRPDGRKILFTTLAPFVQNIESGEIYVMDPDGENMINLTQTPEKETTASWSLDGEKIVFERRLREQDVAIFVIDADGQNV